MLEQVGGPSLIVKALICDSKWAPLCQPYGKMSVSYPGQQDRDACSFTVGFNDFPELIHNIQISTFPFLGTFQCTAAGNLWNTKYFFLLFLLLCIRLNCAQVQALLLPWNHFWGEETFCVTSNLIHRKS